MRATLDRAGAASAPGARAALLAWVAAGALVAGLVVTGDVGLAATSVALFVAVLGIVVVTGWARQPNLGQLGFMGVGAYVAAWLDGWPWGVRVVAGGLAAAAAGVPIGVAAARVRGLALGALTLLGATTIWSLGRTPSVMERVGGSNSTGVLLPRPSVARSDGRYLVLVLAVAAVALATAVAFRRTRSGRAIGGLATAQRALVAEGWNPRRLMVLAFAVSAFYGGVGGVVLGSSYGSLSAADIDPLRSLLVFAQVAVLGTAFTAAAAVSCALIAAFVVWSLPATWLGIASGLGLVVAGAVAPRGYLDPRRSR